MSKTPVERIVHKTGDLPFSLHHTVTDSGEKALYLHCHPEAEILYLKEGDLLFYVENSAFTLHSGDAIFIPPNLLHYAIAQDSSNPHSDFQACVFSLSMLEDYLPFNTAGFFTALRQVPLQCICVISAQALENRHLLTSVRQIVDFREQELSSYELALTGHLLLIWQELYNRYFSAVSRELAAAKDQAKLQQSLLYMRQRLAEPLTLTELAKQAGFSEGYYCHCFHAVTGLSPFAYLLRLRIVKSCEYLTGTDKKVTEIATLCGFNSVSYFNRVFVKIMHTTPSAYRKSPGQVL